MSKVVKMLKENNLRVTPIRKELLQIFLDSKSALSNQDIEEHLPEADRITLYRSLKSFQEKGIIHKAFDGTETAKYAACNHECTEHEHHDEHLHFHCTTCDNTFCVDEIAVPKVDLPAGFKAHNTSIVVEGICGSCG